MPTRATNCAETARTLFLVITLALAASACFITDCPNRGKRNQAWTSQNNVFKQVLLGQILTLNYNQQWIAKLIAMIEQKRIGKLAWSSKKQNHKLINFSDHLRSSFELFKNKVSF